MTRSYFGTDGVRGTVGEAPMTADFVLRLGYAAGKVLAARGAGAADRPGVLVGKDTRISGYMIEAALEAGFSAAGVDVLLCGPLYERVRHLIPAEQVKERGDVSLRGKSEPIPVFAVRAGAGARA